MSQRNGRSAPSGIVVKIGSALLVDSATRRCKRDWLASLADDIAALRAGGKEVHRRLVGRHRARPHRARAAASAR